MHICPRRSLSPHLHLIFLIGGFFRLTSLVISDGSFKAWKDLVTAPRWLPPTHGGTSYLCDQLVSLLLSSPLETHSRLSAWQPLSIGLKWLLVLQTPVTSLVPSNRHTPHFWLYHLWACLPDMILYQKRFTSSLSTMTTVSILVVSQIPLSHVVFAERIRFFSLLTNPFSVPLDSADIYFI